MIHLAGPAGPLGWASAFVVQAKAMLQHTWARGLGWDAALPPDMAAQWAQWEEEIARLRLFAVPRYYYQNLSKNWIKELVLSCDASEDACAAVAYMRAVSTDGGIVCHLVMAKTRLMLLKTLSVPQGQLMGCQQATRLAKTVSILHLPFVWEFCFNFRSFPLIFSSALSFSQQHFIFSNVLHLFFNLE